MKTIYATAALSLAMAGVAYSADLPSRAALPIFVPPPTFVWTGFYLGAFAGGHISAKTVTAVNVVPLDFGKTGFTAGGLAGFNWQFDRIVTGVEGEVGYSDYSKSMNFIGAAGGAITGSTNGDLEGRIRGRIGYAAGSFGFGNTLFFVAGGASFLQDKLMLTDTSLPSTALISLDRVGYNIGGGVEVAITHNWTVRAEYIFDDYGTRTAPFSAATGGALIDRQVRITDNTVRAAIGYKFDWAAPAVVARY